MRAILVASLAGALAAAPASAAVQVAHSDPERFTDADRAGGLTTAASAAQALARHLELLGESLPPGQELRVELLDIDLAGRIAPELDPSAARRVMDRSTWPRIRLRYALSAHGRALARGEELVSWRDYLERPTARFAGDPLRFEKAMLSEWFEARIGGRNRRASR